MPHDTPGRIPRHTLFTYEQYHTLKPLVNSCFNPAFNSFTIILHPPSIQQILSSLCTGKGWSVYANRWNFDLCKKSWSQNQIFVVYMYVNLKKAISISMSLSFKLIIILSFTCMIHTSIIKAAVLSLGWDRSRHIFGLLGITLIDHIIVGNDGVRTVLSGEMSIDSPVPKGTDPKDRPRTPLDDMPQIEYY